MSDQSSNLTDAFCKAFKYAFYLHRTQLRKGSQTPYISHLMAVSSLVLENGGNETEAIAALLHDAVEDQGGLKTLTEIRNKFGEDVAMIVEACSDTVSSPKPDWRERKVQYIEKLKTAPTSVLRVSQADKLHNLRSIYIDYQQIGEELWKRFRGRKAGTLWYYHQLVDVYRIRGNSAILTELEMLLKKLDHLVEKNQNID